MTEKTFTQSEMEDILNNILLPYFQALDEGKMTIMEYTLVDMIILKIKREME